MDSSNRFNRSKNKYRENQGYIKMKNHTSLCRSKNGRI